MEGTAAVVGIDVSKDRLDVHIRPSGETFAVERTASGLDALCRRLREIAPRIVALEATGGFEAIATAALAAAGLPVAVVNPAQVRSFARALGRRAKTDPIDAAVIAHFAAATGVEVRPLKDKGKRSLRAHLPAWAVSVLDQLGAEGFELTLWPTQMTTRRVAASAGSRS